MMGYQARRELLAHVASSYREATHAQKTTILDEFVAATGYARKYAIRLLTRGRAHKSNDQCHVEQKNGTIVRQLVGYDRYEGQQAYRQLTELYRAVRLYINFFQPSMKLVAKERQGAKVTKKCDAAQTPHQRPLAARALSEAEQRRLAALSEALDPVALRRQMETLQRAFWRHAHEAQAARGQGATAAPAAAASLNCNVTIPEGPAAVAAAWQHQSEHRYRWRGRPRAPHTWRTRPNPFEGVSEKIEAWLAAEPERTAKSLLKELQQQYPGRYGAGQLRTLQRRVKEWRQETLIHFNEEWLDQDRVSGKVAAEGARMAAEGAAREGAGERLASIEGIDRLMAVGSCVV